MIATGKRRKLVSLKKSVPPALALIFMTFQAVQIAATFLIIYVFIGRMERREIDDKGVQFAFLMGREQKGIERLVQSYAEWIETYDFVKDPGSDIASTYYTKAWQARQEVDLVLVVDRDGTVIWTSDAAVGGSDGAVPGSLAKSRFAREDRAVFPASFGAFPLAPTGGIVMIGGEPAVVAAWPVSDDAASLAPTGILLFARILGKERQGNFLPGDAARLVFVARGASGSAETFVSTSGPVMTESIPVTDPNGAIIGEWLIMMRSIVRTATRGLAMSIALLAAAVTLAVYFLSLRLVTRVAIAPVTRSI